MKYARTMNEARALSNSKHLLRSHKKCVIFTSIQYHTLGIVLRSFTTGYLPLLRLTIVKKLSPSHHRFSLLLFMLCHHYESTVTTVYSRLLSITTGYCHMRTIVDDRYQR